MALATVLIPTMTDRGPLLRYSIGSVIDQTVKDIDIFVIGDGVNEKTRRVIHELQEKYPRISFFDHPKHHRRGEPNRHQALMQADSKIVCYLCDRDLYFPEHVETMLGLLEDADFAHTRTAYMDPDGRLRVVGAVDLTKSYCRRALTRCKTCIALSTAAHTLEMYHRLPFGWRTTPNEFSTDTYMFAQFLSEPDCRVAYGAQPSVLWMQRGDASVSERQPELTAVYSRLHDPVFRQRLLEGLERERISVRGRIKQVLFMITSRRTRFARLIQAIRRAGSSIVRKAAGTSPPARR